MKYKKIKFFINFIVIYFFLIILIKFFLFPGICMILGVSHPIIYLNSNNLLPSLEKGNVVLIKNIDDLNKGDIINYYCESSTCISRIININENSLNLQGDNNLEQLNYEKDILKSQIIGKVLYKFPNFINKNNLLIIYQILILFFSLLFTIFFYKIKKPREC